jgi:flagellin-like hook-associated protein FlgL
LIQISALDGKRIYSNNNNKRGGAVSKLDSVIAEVESVLEKLGGVQNRLREIKEDSQAVEKARDSLRRPRSKKSGAH